MRAVFMGTPEYAVPTLKALHEIADVVAVYSQPPRAAGRGQKERPTPVHAHADVLGIPVHTPLKFDAAACEAFAMHDADIAVVIAYGLLLPQAVLDAPRLGCVNLHGSLLPRWRGAAPIQRAVMAGDTQTGVDLMQMSLGLDEGPVLARRTTDIGDMTAGDLHDALSQISADLLAQEWSNIGKHEPSIQQGETVYAKKISKEEAAIHWSQNAADVLRQIHGLSPFPGAWSLLNDVRVKFLRAELVDLHGQAGSILDTQMTIACGQGAIRPVVLQRAGKKAASLTDYLRGFPVQAGQKLG